jgi:hypothetical protein
MNPLFLKKVKTLTHRLDVKKDEHNCIQISQQMCKIQRGTIKISFNVHSKMVACVFLWNLDKGAHYLYHFLHPMLMKHQRLLDHFLHYTCKEMVKNDFMCLLGPTPRGRGTIASNKLTLVKIVVFLIIFVFTCFHFLGCSHFFLSPTI